MKIKALKNFSGSLNGFEVTTFEKGTVLDVDDTIANLFVEAGFCEPINPKPKANAD